MLSLDGSEVPSAYANVFEMSVEGRGKVRHLAGWTVAKMLNACRNYISDNVNTEDDNVFDKVKKEYLKKELLQVLRSKAKFEHENSSYKDTLSVTDDKQYRRQGLTYVNDPCHLFFLSLEQKRVIVLNHEKLSALKSELVIDGKNNIKNDQGLFDKWTVLFRNVPQKFRDDNGNLSHDTKGLLIELFEDLIDRYMNMGAKQYLRDFRRDFEWKKKEALRIKVLQRTQVKQQRERKVW